MFTRFQFIAGLFQHNFEERSLNFHALGLTKCPEKTAMKIDVTAITEPINTSGFFLARCRAYLISAIRPDRCDFLMLSFSSLSDSNFSSNNFFHRSSFVQYLILGSKNAYNTSTIKLESTIISAVTRVYSSKKLMSTYK